jgi:hypothetical protein
MFANGLLNLMDVDEMKRCFEESKAERRKVGRQVGEMEASTEEGERKRRPVEEDDDDDGWKR